MNYYTRSKFSKTTNLPFTTIANYVSRGILEPKVKVGKSRGSSHIFNDHDVLELLLIRRMVSVGVALKVVYHLMKQFRQKKLIQKIIRQQCDFILIIDQEQIESISKDDPFPFEKITQNATLINWKHSNYI